MHFFGIINGAKQTEGSREHSHMKLLLNDKDLPKWATPHFRAARLSGAFSYTLEDRILSNIVPTNAFVGPNTSLCFKYLKLKSIKKKPNYRIGVDYGKNIPLRKYLWLPSLVSPQSTQLLNASVELMVMGLLPQLLRSLCLYCCRKSLLLQKVIFLPSSLTT